MSEEVATTATESKKVEETNQTGEIDQKEEEEQPKPGDVENSEENIDEKQESTTNPEEDEEPKVGKKREVVEDDENKQDEEAEAQEGRTQEDLDDDQKVENPAYIPKTGKFYMHDDDRRVENGELNEEDRDEKKRSRADGMWKHDRFDEKFQRPKSKKQIVTKYGFDIRTDDKDDNSGDKDTTAPDSTEDEAAASRKVLPKDRKNGPSRNLRGNQGTSRRRPIKRREREDVDDSEEKGEGTPEVGEKPAPRRIVQKEKVIHKQTKQKPSSQSSHDAADETEEENLRRGQRRTIPSGTNLRRGVGSRLRGRITPVLSTRKSQESSSSAVNRRGGLSSTRGAENRRGGRISSGPAPRREYNNDQKNDDRFENHRRGVIRGAGVIRGFTRGTTRGIRAPVTSRFQGKPSRDEDNIAPRRSNNGYSTSHPQPTRGGFVPRGGPATSAGYPGRRFNDFRGGYHRGPSQPIKSYPVHPIAPVGVVPVGAIPTNVPPPQMTRGTTHHPANGHHHAPPPPPPQPQNQQRMIRQPTDVVYFDPVQQQVNRQPPPSRIKKVIPIVDPNIVDQK